jgi:hypothetical protein
MEFATAGEEAAAAGCDRAWRRGLVLLVLLRVDDVSFDDDVCRHDREIYACEVETARPYMWPCPTGVSTHPHAGTARVCLADR